MKILGPVSSWLMNSYGEQGWELAFIEHGLLNKYVFKRPIQQEQVSPERLAYLLNEMGVKNDGN